MREYHWAWDATLRFPVSDLIGIKRNKLTSIGSDWDAYTEGYKTPEYSEVDLRVGPEPRPGRRIGPGPVTAGNITSITQLSRALYDSWSRSPTLSLRRVDPNPMIEYLAQGLDFVRTPQELISIDGSGTEVGHPVQSTEIAELK